MATTNQTLCHMREVAYLLPAASCDRCQQPAPRYSTAGRVAIDLDLDCPTLLLVTVSVHYCAACQHYFRAQPPFLRPDAVYTNRVVAKAVEAVYQDSMAMRRVPARLARDFWVRPSEGIIRQWCRAYRATFDFAADYQPWVVREFSGILCVDEVYQNQLALLLAVDPAAPDGDRLVGYQLVHGSVDAANVEAFLSRLKTAGVEPDEVISDGSSLYPTLFARIWPTAAHQLCLFHETRRVTKAVMEVIQAARKTLPTPPALSGRGWSGPLRDQPPTENPNDLAYQRWQLRQATRQSGIAQVHTLAQHGVSQRAMARQLGLHRKTVKAWLQLDPPAEVAPALAATWHERTLPDVDTVRRTARQTRHHRVHELAGQGLSYSEIAHQVGIHRITVKRWLMQDPMSAGAGEPARERPAPPAPPAPWQDWDEVRQVREALRKHRLLLLRRPEHLKGNQQVQVAALLEGPLGAQLQVARSFLEEWYRLWSDEDGQRQTLEEARAHYEGWSSNEIYTAVPALRRVQERMTETHFERLSQFLRNPDWEATNNGAERAGRGFRHRQAPHFNLRGKEAIEGAIVVAACQQKAAATTDSEQGANRSTRGRKRHEHDGLSLAA